MRWSSTGPLGVFLALILLLMPLDALAGAAPSQRLQFQTRSTDQAPSPPAVIPAEGPFDDGQIEAFMATLSDEQVRRLLVAELKKSAATSNPRDAASESPGRLQGLINGLRNKITLIESRLSILRSDQRLTWEEEPDLLTYLGSGEPDGKASRAIFHVGGVLLLGFLAQWIYRRAIGPARNRIETAAPLSWWSKLGGLSLRAALDLIGILVFAVAVLGVFSFFFQRTHAQVVLMATYLAAIISVQAIWLVSQYLLAPGQSALRLFPIDNALARYLHRWVAAIAMVGSFGFLTCGLFHVAGTSEGLHLTMVFAVGLVIASMLIFMIIDKRKPVAASLAENLSPEGLMARMVAYWHHFAIFTVVLMYFAGIILSLMDSQHKLPGLKTLVVIALYFPADWILGRILDACFTLVGSNFRLTAGPGSASDLTSRKQAAPAGHPSQDIQSLPWSIKIERVQHVFRASFRAVLAALFLIWILGLWGFDVPHARSAARAIFNILFVIGLCYVGWELISAAIQKRLQAEMPDVDEDMEEGGSGGSRLGTLLLLLRKFLFSIILIMAALIILSTMGIHIGPLIAGAGVVGLAIGFGAQALVKDIISGLFFLIDDAFRVGDYIDVGGILGTVERISIRSMSLRHPRGMVHTIPFGDIANVTNFSRDYIITKLDFRVRYDTDVEKVRKVIKKHVYAPIMQNEALASKLLDKIKSQGVRKLDDSAMIMRVKFKTIPGEQFVIRKEVFRLMKEAFQKAGIEFAHRNVTVYMPTEKGHVNGAAQAGAAAAVSAEPSRTTRKETPGED